MTIFTKIVIDILILVSIIFDCDGTFPLKYNRDCFDWLNLMGSILMYITMIGFGILIWFI